MITQFRIATGLLVLTLVMSVGTYLGWWSLFIFIGPYALGHWLAIVAAAYLVIAVPLYAYLKRTTSVSRAGLVKFHVFGNLLAFLPIAVHFGLHMGRLADGPLRLGDGLAGFILILFVVGAGFMLRFGVAAAHRASVRTVHVGSSLSLVVVIGIHALRNFGLL